MKMLQKIGEIEVEVSPRHSEYHKWSGGEPWLIKLHEKEIATELAPQGVIECQRLAVHRLCINRR